MNSEKYDLKSESDFTVFQFISQGIKGKIDKVIHFQKLDQPNLYNLAFGDRIGDFLDIDDLKISNNGDRDKVLTTVASALYLFFTKYPEAMVYAKGSTPSRTRLYRIGITKFYDQAQNDFYLFGQIDDDFHTFETGKTYDGFLVVRKFI